MISGFHRNRFGSALFNPATLSPLSWCEPNVGSSAKDSGTQVTVSDLSGTAVRDLTESVYSAGVSLSENECNGYDAVNFANTLGKIQLGIFAVNLSGSGGSYTIFVLTKSNAAIVLNSFLYDEKDKDTEGGAIYKWSGNNIVFEVWNAGDNYPGTPVDIISAAVSHSPNFWVLHTLAYNVSTNQLRLWTGNTLQVTDTLTPTVDAAALGVGGLRETDDDDVNGSMVGYFRSFIVYDSLLSDANIASIQDDYFKRKYNLTRNYT